MNDGRYCNPEVDRLLNEARSINDDEKRKEIYDAAQTILQDELPIIYTSISRGLSWSPRRSRASCPIRTE